MGKCDGESNEEEKRRGEQDGQRSYCTFMRAGRKNLFLLLQTSRKPVHAAFDDGKQTDTVQ